MKEIIYNKLVRDKIPEIIKADGKECLTKILDDEEYINALKEKIFEEAEEVKKASNYEELCEEMADIIEILAALAVNCGKNLGQIIEIASFKRSKRGGFDGRVFLEKVLEMK